MDPLEALTDSESKQSTIRRKICARCELFLPIKEFATKGRGLQPVCLLCRKDKEREHYKKNRVAILKKKTEWAHKKRNECRQFLGDYLLQHPCVDCGEADILVLEFDHLRDKSDTISSLMTKGNMGRMKEEIKKCEVVCANCHKRRTDKRRNSWRTKHSATGSRTLAPTVKK